MATYFLDLENGNDSANGLSFANRKKTLASITPVAGDTIRIMASPSPVETSLTGIYQAGNSSSGFLTAITDPTSAPFVSLTGYDNRNALWTSDSQKVTVSVDFKPYVKGGTLSTRPIHIESIAGFKGLSGLLFHGAIKKRADVDLSNLSRLSFWISVSEEFAANTFAIALCSDVAGATIVHKMPINTALSPGRLYPVVVDNGSAFTGTLRSIGFYALTKVKNFSMTLNNIVACLGAGQTNSLTHQTLVSKNDGTDFWHAIDFIDFDRITYTTTPDDSRGDVQAVAYINTEPSRRELGLKLWTRETIKLDILPASSINDGQINRADYVLRTKAAGSSGRTIQYQFGYDRTAMTTQNSETWLDGLIGTGVGFGVLHAYSVLNKCAFVRYADGISIKAGNCTLSTIPQTSHNLVQGVFIAPGLTGTTTISNLKSHMNNQWGLAANSQVTVTTADCSYNLYAGGIYNGHSDSGYGTLTCNQGYLNDRLAFGSAYVDNSFFLLNNLPTGFHDASANGCSITTITANNNNIGLRSSNTTISSSGATFRNNNYGVFFDKVSDASVQNLTMQDNQWAHFWGNSGQFHVVTGTIRSTTNNEPYHANMFLPFSEGVIPPTATDVEKRHHTFNKASLYLQGCTYDAGWVWYTDEGWAPQMIDSNNYDPVYGSLWADFYSLITQPIIGPLRQAPESANGFRILLFENSPLKSHRLSNIFVSAGSPITYSCWVRPEGCPTQIRVSKANIGLSADVTSSVITDLATSNNGYTYVELTFTPLTSGFAELYADVTIPATAKQSKWVYVDVIDIDGA